jgi:hypothetical protein
MNEVPNRHESTLWRRCPMRTDLWNYPDGTTTPLDIEGFKVRATDGEIGKIDEATYDVGSAFVVVDTGPWILGRKVLIPGGMIERIDLDRREVEVRLAKDQIKNAPELDEVTDYRSDTYREQVGTYYSTYS